MLHIPTGVSEGDDEPSDCDYFRYFSVSFFATIEKKKKKMLADNILNLSP